MKDEQKIAVFLDLQGTLGGDARGSIMEFSFFPGAIEAIDVQLETYKLLILNLSCKIMAYLRVQLTEYSEGGFAFRFPQVNLITY